MKLKTKLVIVFMVVMVFPMLFTGVMTRAFVPEKATEIPDRKSTRLNSSRCI